MNTTLMAQNGYTAQNAHTRTATDQEYDAFAKITAGLKTATDHNELVRALHRNRELWAVLASDVATDANRLPPPLRAQIVYLAEFTAQHSSKVLRKEASHNILIEINTSVMRGLRNQGARG